MAIIAGEHVESHTDASQIRTWLYQVAQSIQADYHHIAHGANAAGAWVAGALPHRAEFGLPSNKRGLNCTQMLEQKLPIYWLHGLEAAYDFVDPSLARAAFMDADCVINVHNFVTEDMLTYCDIVLPAAAMGEYAGSFINMAGILQSFTTAVLPPESAKPSWKIYKAVGKLLALDPIDDADLSSITELFSASAASSNVVGNWPLTEPTYTQSSLMRVGHWPALRTDAYVRHSEPLQNTLSDCYKTARIHPETAKEFSVSDGGSISLSQGNEQHDYVCVLDSKVAPGSVWLPTAIERASNLGLVSGMIDILVGGDA